MMIRFSNSKFITIVLLTQSSLSSLGEHTFVSVSGSDLGSTITIEYKQITENKIVMSIDLIRIKF